MYIIKIGIMFCIMLAVSILYYFILKKTRNNIVVRIIGTMIIVIIFVSTYSILSSRYLEYLIEYKNNEAIIQCLKGKKEEMVWKIEEDNFSVISTTNHREKKYYLTTKQENGKWKIIDDKKEIKVKRINFEEFSIALIRIERFDKLYIDVSQLYSDKSIDVTDDTNNSFQKYIPEVSRKIYVTGYYKEIENKEVPYNLTVNNRTCSIELKK